MLYDLKRSHYCDAATFEVNKLPPRAYFIPFSLYIPLFLQILLLL